MPVLLSLSVLIALVNAQDNSSALRLLQSQFSAPATTSSCYTNVGWQFTSGYGSSSGDLQCGNLVCRGYFGSSSISFNGPGGTATSNYPLSKVDSPVLCPCFTDYDCYYTWTSYGAPASLQPKCLGVDLSNGLPGTCGQGTAVTTSTPTVTVASGCPLSNPCGSSCSIATCNSGCGGSTLLSTSYAASSYTLTLQGCQCSSNSDCSNSFWGSLPTRVCSEGFCRAVAKTTSTAVCVTQTAVLPPPGSRLNCYQGTTSAGTVVAPTLSTDSPFSYCAFVSYVCDGTPSYPCTTSTGSTTVATGLAVGTTIYQYSGTQSPFFISITYRSLTTLSNFQVCTTSGCNTPLSSYSSSSLPCTASSLPYSCGAGQYNTNAGTTSASCSTCGANTYSQGGATTCTACPSGTTSNQGSTSSSACLSASTCSSCVASLGYWCPSSTSSTSGVCASSSSYSCSNGLVSTSTSCGTYPSYTTCSTCAGGPGYWCSSNSKCATASSSSICPESTISSSSSCPGSQGGGGPNNGGPSSNSCSLPSGSCSCSLSLTYNGQSTPYFQNSCPNVDCNSCSSSPGISGVTVSCSCSSSSNNGLSSGAIGGIAAVIVVVVVLIRRKSATKTLVSAPVPANATNYSAGMAPQIHINPAPQAYNNPVSNVIQAQPLPQAYPPSNNVTWTSTTAGKDTWYVSSTGETQWTLPPGAILRS